MSEQITITKIAQRWQVVAGRLDNCRMWFYAPGLEVYVKGSGTAQYHVIANIAVNEAIARNIPAVALRRNPLLENEYGGTKPPQRKAPHQKSLFPIDTYDNTEKNE